MLYPLNTHLILVALLLLFVFYETYESGYVGTKILVLDRCTHETFAWFSVQVRRLHLVFAAHRTPLLAQVAEFVQSKLGALTNLESFFFSLSVALVLILDIHVVFLCLLEPLLLSLDLLLQERLLDLLHRVIFLYLQCAFSLFFLFLVFGRSQITRTNCVLLVTLLCIHLVVRLEMIR